MGSETEEYEELANGVGALLARLGVNLLTGAGNGVMRWVSRAFTQAERRRGICIGVVPCFSERERGRPKAGYPNEFVELAIYTHLPYAANTALEISPGITSMCFLVMRSLRCLVAAALQAS